MLTDTNSAIRRRKMESAGVSLAEYVNGQIYYGIKTGFNKAFVIDGTKRAELIAKDPKNIAIIKPLAIGDDIRKWRINYKDKWFIYSPWDLNIDNYTAVKNHLSQWYEELKARPECQNGRYNWWCMARYGAEYVHTFEQPKIIYPVIAKESRFAFDTTGAFTNDKAFIIPVNELYLLGILNSSPVWEYLKSMCSELLGKSLELRSIYINKIPIPHASTTEREAISQLVQKCLNAKGVNCEIWEKEIDEQVATLYGL
ncbi:MAG: TaqI-like C-terminal specificity domain-containing protein [Nostoc sp. ChiSLP01]|nr:TaqI-like C-terminal specificity domain-containing protein [Nostoc sp. CmiSLP01]MDZ8288255.1 TaqI-like C-terminal specificity domain-containing protein [Nostoc sp. ChiSLP01]